MRKQSILLMIDYIFNDKFSVNEIIMFTKKQLLSTQ